MIRLVAGEVRKLFSTWLWLWTLLAAVGLTGLYASLAIAFGDSPDNPTPPLSTPEGQRTLLSVGQGAGALVAVLAAIGYTGEFRHHTATPTFLGTPRRWRIVLAKLITYPLLGVGYGIVCVAGTTAIALPWLSARDIHVSLWRNGIPGTLTGAVVAVGLYGALGVGLGALLRNQVATVVGLLVYLFVAEPIVTRIPALRGWTNYLPGSASAALTRVSQVGQEYLQPWQGGLVLIGYALGFALVAVRVAVSRDIN